MDNLYEIFERLYEKGIILGATYALALAFVGDGEQLISGGNAKVTLAPMEGHPEFMVISDNGPWIITELEKYEQSPTKTIKKFIGGEEATLDSSN